MTDSNPDSSGSTLAALFGWLLVVKVHVHGNVRFALGRARQLAGIREIPKYAIVQALAVVRADLTAVGAALADAQRIDKPDDVFFLTLREAGEGLSGRSLRDVVSSGGPGTSRNCAADGSPACCCRRARNRRTSARASLRQQVPWSALPRPRER